jgi:hypothetical protein
MGFSALQKVEEKGTVEAELPRVFVHYLVLLQHFYTKRGAARAVRGRTNMPCEWNRLDVDKGEKKKYDFEDSVP